MERLETDVCVVGGGPVGLVVALLLAKAGVRVHVLESHENFDREYRGEVLQPLFSRIMHQLNLQEYIESRPHSKFATGEIWFKDKRIADLDFTAVSEEVPYALWMPQPILLQALYEKAQEFPNFSLWFHAPIKKLIHEDDRVVGVIAEQDHQEVEVRAKVTIGADGRFSTVRRLGGFEMEAEHYENDVIWFTIPRPEGYRNSFRILISDAHTSLLAPKYPNSIQVGVFLKKGEWKEYHDRGIDSFAEELRGIDPMLQEFADRLADFKPFTPLQSRIMYVKDWAQNGLLLIGDAAHCSSPAGAVGISVGVETALVTADVLYHALQDGDVSAERLGEVQRIRAEKIRNLHAIQERAEKVIGSPTPFVKRIRRYVIPLAAKTPFVKMVQRRILLAEDPYVANPRFVFENAVPN